MHTSVVSMKRMGDSGLFVTLRSPVSCSGVRVSLISFSQTGWVKSPVPTRFSPLIFAYLAISECSFVRLLLGCNGHGYAGQL